MSEMGVDKTYNSLDDVPWGKGFAVLKGCLMAMPDFWWMS